MGGRRDGGVLPRRLGHGALPYGRPHAARGRELPSETGMENCREWLLTFSATLQVPDDLEFCCVLPPAECPPAPPPPLTAEEEAAAAAAAAEAAAAARPPSKGKVTGIHDQYPSNEFWSYSSGARLSLVPLVNGIYDQYPRARGKSRRRRRPPRSPSLRLLRQRFRRRASAPWTWMARRCCTAGICTSCCAPWWARTPSGMTPPCRAPPLPRLGSCIMCTRWCGRCGSSGIPKETFKRALYDLK